MKITKAQGRACLIDAELSVLRGVYAASYNSWEALDELADRAVFKSDFSPNEFLTALCLCAAIAGVKQ